ncbi:MAG: ABC transporter ATP-binding protein [Solirubrobacterales bacterium]
MQASNGIDTAARTTLPALVLDGVSKRFSLPTDRVQTLKERALHPIRSRGRNTFDALQDVAFHVDKGEFFGLVGRNGSGKSTLLKCIAGIYAVDDGAIYHDGRVSSFIELGVGFNPELSAYDNVILNATLLGLDREAARKRYPEVMDFAELWEFENLKLKNYSSGMYVRLAFSVMLQVEADILLIDEVLAVGDAAFQQKCFDQFARLRDEKKTIIFVTHGMDAVRRFCDRAVLLDRGKLMAIGSPADIGDKYLELNFGAESVMAEGELTEPGGGARLADFWVEGDDDVRHGSIKQGEDFTLHAVVEFRERVTDPWIAFSLTNDAHQVLMTASSAQHSSETGTFEAGESAQFTLAANCVFAPGRCGVVLEAGVSGSPQTFFRSEGDLSFVVTGPDAHGASVVVPNTVSVKAADPAQVTEGDGR